MKKKMANVLKRIHFLHLLNIKKQNKASWQDEYFCFYLIFLLHLFISLDPIIILSAEFASRTFIFRNKIL